MYKRQVWLPIRQDELLVLVPKSNPLAGMDAVPVQRMKTEPFIESYPGMETDITLLFDKLKTKPNTSYSTMDITATYAMAVSYTHLDVYKRQLRNSKPSR